MGSDLYYSQRQKHSNNYPKLVQALQEIRNTQGKVCKEYEVCSHIACESSYASWTIADEALQQAKFTGSSV